MTTYTCVNCRCEFGVRDDCAALVGLPPKCPACCLLPGHDLSDPHKWPSFVKLVKMAPRLSSGGTGIIDTDTMIFTAPAPQTSPPPQAEPQAFMVHESVPNTPIDWLTFRWTMIVRRFDLTTEQEIDILSAFLQSRREFAALAARARSGEEAPS